MSETKETKEVKITPFKPDEAENVDVSEITKRMIARTTQFIAVGLVIGFLLLFFLAFAYLFSLPKETPEAAAAAVSQTIDLMKTISAVLSGLVGSIVMYYFGVERRNQANQARTG